MIYASSSRFGKRDGILSLFKKMAGAGRKGSNKHHTDLSKACLLCNPSDHVIRTNHHTCYKGLMVQLLNTCSLILYSAVVIVFYQLAFLTPGRLPSNACILKLYYAFCVSTFSFRPGGLLICIQEGRTLDSLKSLKIPRPFPPIKHRPRICVGRV